MDNFKKGKRKARIINWVSQSIYLIILVDLCTPAYVQLQSGEQRYMIQLLKKCLVNYEEHNL